MEQLSRLCRPLMPSETGEAPVLQTLPGIRAVLFDVYGTILTCGQGEVGSAGIISPTAAIGTALRNAGVPVDDETAEQAAALLAAGISAWHARRKAEGVEYPEVEIRDVWQGVLTTLRETGGIPYRIDSETVCRIAIEYECRVNPAWPMPGLGETLLRLDSAAMRLGIVSNAQFYTPLLLECFEETGWNEGRFERDLCSWSFERGEAKPSPALLAQALDTLATGYGIQPVQTVFVGNDMLNDLTPAMRLGCRTALFAGDAKSLRWRRDDPRTRGVQPELVITRLPQLAECIL